MRKIFITGGHMAPAKAVVQEMLPGRDFRIYYIGRREAMEDDRALALEYEEIQKFAAVTYLTITTGRLQRQFMVNVSQSVRALLKIFIGLGQAFIWTVKYRPEVILSFGGYVAVPVVFWGFLLGVPVVTHEQTVGSGLANKFVGYLSSKVLVSWPESLGRFPAGKVVFTGNPIRREVLGRSGRRASGEVPTVYITGGSQGSHAINAAVLEALPKLVSKWRVIHQTGSAARGGYDDFERLELKAKALAKRGRYEVYRYLPGEESARALKEATLVVSRAGANTVTELLYLSKPAVLIPIPWSRGGEQQKNAEVLSTLGLAEILPQDKLSGKRLVEILDKMLANLPRYRVTPEEKRKYIFPEAAKKIVEVVSEVSARQEG